MLKQLTLFILVATSFVACITPKSKDTDNDGVTNKADKCPEEGTAGKVDADGCPLPERQLQSVRLYMDNSLSNLGYMKGPTGFKDVVSDLVSELDHYADAKGGFKMNFVADAAIQPYFKSGKDFISDLNNGNIPAGKCSELHHMLDMMMGKSGADDVSLLVTDNILSFCDDPKKNLNNLSELRTSVKDVFREQMKKKGYAASLYAFTSNFSGTYYAASAGDKNIAFTGTRPYYIWVIGAPELLSKVESYLTKTARFRPVKELHFGESATPVSGGKVLFYTGKTGEWKTTSNGDLVLTDIECGSKKGPIEFVAAFNLATLPDYAKSSAYIREHLTSSYANLEVIAIADKTTFSLKGDKKKERDIVEESTHFITFRLNDLVKDEENVNLQLKKESDLWYESWSSLNDTNPADGKTFALKDLVDGVKEAYAESAQPFLNATLTLKKE